MAFILFNGTTSSSPPVVSGGSVEVFASGTLSLSPTIGAVADTGVTFTPGVYEALATEIELTDTQLFTDQQPPSKLYASATFSVTAINIASARVNRVLVVDVITASSSFEFMRGASGQLQIVNKLPLVRELAYEIWKKQ